MRHLRGLLLVLFAAPAPLAAAAWTPPELLGAAGLYPSIAVQGDGEAMAVWTTHWPTRPPHELGLVWSRRYVPGQGWQTAEPIYDHARNGGTRTVSVAARPDGGWVATWLGRAEGGPWVLWLSIRRTGESWNPPERVSEESWQPSGTCRMGVDAHGDVLVLWHASDAREKGALFSRRRVAGRWEPIDILDDVDFDDSDTLALGVGGDGTALAAWSKRHREGLGGWRMFISDFDTKRGWSPPTAANTEPLVTIFTYAIAFDRRGEALLVWQAGNYWDLYARRLLPGRVWEAPRRIGAGMMASAGYDDDGNAFVVWEGRRLGFGGIEATRFDRRTGSWEPGRMLEIDTGADDAIRPKVRVAGGHVVAAWHHSGNRVLSSATYDAQAGWTRLPDVQAPRPSPYDPLRMPTPHDLAVDSAGNAFLVWMDEPEIWWSGLPSAP